MPRIDGIESKVRNAPTNVRFEDLAKLCQHYFGDPRNSNGGSHRTYETPWQGDPRVNIQNKGGMAKPYQVKQVLAAIDRMKEQGDV
ncbi:toxin HicA [Zafaria sp. Z1313]|uniref:toxin HicA n=1 Tax=Zafaria sp. Z1313 TaxID=3423202 RepID=UPI003D302E54